MIKLFDSYSLASRDLDQTLIDAKIDCPTIVLRDVGFLPAHVESPYRYFMDQASDTSAKHSGKPLFFNEVTVPDFWEIKGSNSQADIYDYHHKRGSIAYASPSHLRQVKAVTWLDDKGTIRSVDHYDEHGRRYATTAYSQQGTMIVTTYFSQEGLEVLVENHQTKTIILTINEEIRLFKDKIDFVIYYLKVRQFNLDRIIYNTLADPLLVSHRLQDSGEDIFVWQEEVDKALPGNLTFIFNHGVKRTQHVVVQSHDQWHLLSDAQAKLSVDKPVKLTHLGKHYRFKPTSSKQDKIFILTHTDQIEQLGRFVEALTDFEIHIAALTEMSQKLYDYAHYDNVFLHPNIPVSQIEELLKTSRIYLDVNHHQEVLDVVRTAFEHQLVIFSFENTQHSPAYAAPSHCFAVEKVDKMIEQIRLLVDEGQYSKALTLQRESADLGSLADYRRIFLDEN